MTVGDIAEVQTGSEEDAVPARRMRQPYEACPLCESKNFSKLKETNCTWHACYDPTLPPTMVWCLCHDCGHCFVEGYFTKEALAIIFSRMQDGQDPADLFRPPKTKGPVAEYPIEGRRRISARIVMRVTDKRGKVVSDGDKWLDVGFGNGSLMLTAWEWGYHPIGLDLRQTSVDFMTQRAFEAHCIDFMDYGAPPGSIQVISMANVLEHMPFPKPALNHAHALLSDDGVLFVSTPNRDTAVWLYMDTVRGNPYWQEIEHCHNFTRRRLFALLRELGFDPIDYRINERYRTGMEVVAAKVQRRDAAEHRSQSDR
jgi:SAM-dependent methyltransferase